MADVQTESVLLPENIEKVTRRDGMPHSLTEFNPTSTALLVIDMQNFYMIEGQMSYCAPAHPIVQHAASAARSSGCATSPIRRRSRPGARITAG